MNKMPLEILLIEDSLGDIELIKLGFSQAQVSNHISVISDGEEALDFFDRAESIPSLILLDINLPKVDGFQILNKIRQLEHSKSIPVVMLTSSSAEEDVLACYAAKANSYVTKPVDFEKFLAAIKSIEEFWLNLVQLPHHGVSV